MKKIISSLLILIFFLFSCSEKNQDAKTIKTEQEVITTMVGIGKVLPKNGIIPLAVTQNNQVIAIYKKTGDFIKAGEVIFKMKSVSEDLAVASAQANLQATLQKNKASDLDLDIAQTKLNELKKVFFTSKQLQLKGAETKQQVFLDSIAYVQQLQKLNQLKQSKIYNADLVKENEIQLKASKINLDNQEFKALDSGTLLRFDVTLGQVLSPNLVFGELANLSDLVIEGEIDELYATEIQIGQNVDVYAVGQNKLLAQGVVSFVGSSLQNKSILYETIGEGSDRRVRRFTVTISNNKNTLLVNQKVECKIKLK